MDDLHVGMSIDEVLSLASGLGWKDEEIYLANDRVTMTLSTPADLGARNWIIICTFSKLKLVSAYVGTPDNVYYHPEGAPDDIGEEVQNRTRL